MSVQLTPTQDSRGSGGACRKSTSVSLIPGPVPGSDSRFLALLGNTNVMNGFFDKGSHRGTPFLRTSIACGAPQSKFSQVLQRQRK